MMRFDLIRPCKLIASERAAITTRPARASYTKKETQSTCYSEPTALDHSAMTYAKDGLLVYPRAQSTALVTA